LVTTHKIHNELNGCRQPEQPQQQPQNFTHYLFVVRDPLARLQSWFAYERPPPPSSSATTAKIRTRDRIPYQARLFHDCHFATLNELALYGLDPDDPHDEIFGTFVDDLVPSDDEVQVLDHDPTYQRRPHLCQDRAHMAVQGLVGYYVHNRYNYQYYLQQVEQQDSPPNQNVSIVVIRTEYMQQDWQSIEAGVLHGRQDWNISFARKTNASPKRNEDDVLAPVAQRRLCHELCREIQTYKQILRRAVNLSPSDVEFSLHDLADNCPTEAAAETCPLLASRNASAADSTGTNTTDEDDPSNGRS
jgi:hypothetical protein